MARRPHARCRSVALTLAAGCAALGMFAGCSKPLLSPEEERTQYARYDAMRNQYVPQYVEDEFGRQKPNLRARLTQKD